MYLSIVLFVYVLKRSVKLNKGKVHALAYLNL